MHPDRDLLSFRDGLLLGERERQIAYHVQRCTRCQARLEEIARQERLLTDLPRLSLHDADAERILASIHAPVAPARFRGWTWAAALAGAAAVAIVVLIARPRLWLADPPQQSRSIERAATTAYDAWSDGRLRIEHPTASPHEAARFAQARVGVRPNLAPLRPRYHLAGETGANGFSAIACSIDDAPVMLLIGDRRDLADAPARLLGTKRIEVRDARRTRSFTWSAGTDIYTLVVPRNLRAAEACALCHSEGPSLTLIRRVAL